MRLVRGFVLAAVIAGPACGQRLSEPPRPAVPALTALEQLGNAGPAVYEGSVSGLFSNRKPPTVAYAMAPVFHATAEDGEMLFVGGNFWDGRAAREP